MAAIPVVISGVMFDKHGRTTQLVSLMGEMSVAGLGVGGGPIIPPDQPPGIWGPPGPWPTPPIANPGWPISGPPPWGIEGPPGGGAPPPDGAAKPPPPGGGWGYHPDYGWGYFPMGGGKPQPPGS